MGCRRARVVLFCAVVVALAGLRPDVASAQASSQELARGRYVFGATGGCGCHTAKGQPVNTGGRRYDGPMGKSDRAFLFGLIGLLVGLNVPLGGALVWVWAGTAAFLVVTIANRIRKGLAETARQ